MLTHEEFDSLREGDQVSTVPLFEALSPDEKVLLTVTQKIETKAVFVVTYFGITLGKWTAEKNANGLVWSF